MKKYIIAIAVVFLLVIFPLGSWYYLNSGLTYRKQIRSELEPKGKINQDLANEIGLSNRTTLVHRYLSGDPKTLGKVKLINDQFDENENFQLISILKNSEFYNISDSIGWKKITYPDSINFTSVLFENNFTLIDTGLNIRSVYNAEDSSFTHLVEHIAFILPAKKDLDIELRRQKEK